MFCRIYNISIFSFLFIFISPVYSEDLRIDGDVSFLDVFEAGFRPRNVSGLEKSICETENTEITLLFASGDKLEFYAERISFTVNRSDIVVQIRASSPPISTREAKQIITPFLANNSSRKNDFENYVASVEADSLKAYDGFGFRFDPVKNAKATIGFLAGNTSTDNPLRFVCTIQWTVQNSRADRRNEVITSPTGYETHSMDPASSIPATHNDELPTDKENKPQGNWEREEVFPENESEEEARSLPVWTLPWIMVAALGILIFLLRLFLQRRVS